MMANMEIDLSNSDLREAKQADWRLVADITAEAFETDPVNQHIFGKPKSIRSMFSGHGARNVSAAWPQLYSPKRRRNHVDAPGR